MHGAVWRGRVPSCFSLSPNHDTSREAEPYYVMLPRLGYLPLVMDSVLRHFAKSLPRGEEVHGEEVWVESDGTALKWQYPIGLLYDLHNTNSTLPWQLTVHLKGFPRGELLEGPSREAMEALFMSALKEADCLKHRGHLMGELQRKEHKQLWLGLLNDKLEQFWGVNRKLMETQGEEHFRYIPFRIYQADSERPFIQKLIRPVSAEGSNLTLSHLVEAVKPHRQHMGAVRVVTHGISPPLDTPLQWLSVNLSYADNFLHLVLTPCSTQP